MATDFGSSAELWAYRDCVIFPTAQVCMPERLRTQQRFLSASCHESLLADIGTSPLASLDWQLICTGGSAVLTVQLRFGTSRPGIGSAGQGSREI